MICLGYTHIYTRTHMHKIKLYQSFEHLSITSMFIFMTQRYCELLTCEVLSGSHSQSTLPEDQDGRHKRIALAFCGTEKQPGNSYSMAKNSNFDFHSVRIVIPGQCWFLSLSIALMYSTVVRTTRSHCL